MQLYPNHPNPFTFATRFSYALPGDGHVILEVFDVAGRRVRVLVDRSIGAGRYSEFWDAKDDDGNRVVPGINLYRLKTAEGTCTQRCIYLR